MTNIECIMTISGKCYNGLSNKNCERSVILLFISALVTPSAGPTHQSLKRLMNERIRQKGQEARTKQRGLRPELFSKNVGVL